VSSHDPKPPDGNGKGIGPGPPPSGGSPSSPGTRIALDESDEYRRRLLRLLEDEILQHKANRIERLIAINRYGDVLLARDGTEAQVRPAVLDIARLVLRRPFLLTHNHRFGTAPSDADVRLAAVLGAAEVNSFGASARWRVRRGPAGWPPRRQITDRFRLALAAKRASIYDAGVQAIRTTRRQPTTDDHTRLWVATLEAVWQDLTAADPTHWIFAKENR
jgi:hypothetical protein